MSTCFATLLFFVSCSVCAMESVLAFDDSSDEGIFFSDEQLIKRSTSQDFQKKLEVVKRPFPSKKDKKKSDGVHLSGKVILSQVFYKHNQKYLQGFPQELGQKTFLKPVWPCEVAHSNKKSEWSCADCDIYKVYKEYQQKRLKTDLLRNKGFAQLSCKFLGKHKVIDCIECDDLLHIYNDNK